MERYCLGFLFHENRKQVVLIEKVRPDWQKGRLNGVGGKVKPTETPYDAMVREFAEETGVTYGGWETLTMIGSEHWTCHVFRGCNTEAFDQAETRTDEKVLKLNLNEFYLPENLVPSVQWLIPLGLDPNAEVVRLPWIHQLADAERAVLVQIDRNARARDSIVALRDKVGRLKERLAASEASTKELEATVVRNEAGFKNYVDGLLAASTAWISTLVASRQKADA